MEGDPNISIAIPYYAGFNYLKEAILSVIEQSITNWKLKIVDDNPQAQMEVVNFIDSLRDNRISYIKNKKNLGLAKNWNHCLNNSSSQLITILHSDDRMKNDYLETIIEANKRFPNAAIYYTRSGVIGENGKTKLSLPDLYKNWIDPTRKIDDYLTLNGPDSIKSLLGGNYIVCPTLCYNQKIIPNHRFNPKWKQVLDLEFIFNVLLANHTIIGINRKCFEYRRRSDNTTSLNTKSLVRFMEESEIYDWIEKIGANKKWSQIAKRAKKKQIIKNNLLFCFYKMIFGGQLETAIKIYKFRNSL